MSNALNAIHKFRPDNKPCFNFYFKREFFLSGLYSYFWKNKKFDSILADYNFHYFGEYKNSKFQFFYTLFKRKFIFFKRQRLYWIRFHFIKWRLLVKSKFLRYSSEGIIGSATPSSAWKNTESCLKRWTSPGKSFFMVKVIVAGLS